MSEDQLKAEVARLKTEVQHLMIFCNSTLIPSKELQDENARLKAEVERLEHQVNYWRIEAEVDNARWLRCLQDLEELRASSFVTAVPVEHYERVVKAGDAMNEVIRSIDNTKPSCHANHKMTDAEYEAVQAWNAAKEDKPSV